MSDKPTEGTAVIGAGIWFSGALMHADKPDAPAESDIITENVTVSESGKVLSDSSVSAAVTVKNTERSEAEPYPFYGSVIAMTNPEYINGAVPEKNDDTDEQIPYDEVVEYNGVFCEVYF